MAISTGKVVALIQAMGNSADPAVIEAKVEEWLDAHPEATTTVQDGSITEQKLATSIAQKLGLISSLSDEIDDIGSDVTGLKSAISEIGLNLVGMDTTKLYPVYLPAGSSVTISTADGQPTETAIPLRFYDVNKQYKDFWSLQVGHNSRTITTPSNLGDIYYLNLQAIGAKDIMVNYGDHVFPYKRYDEGYPYNMIVLYDQVKKVEALEEATSDVRGGKIKGWSDVGETTANYITTTGVVQGSDYCALSNYIKVLSGDTISYEGLNCNLSGTTMMAIACYDADKNFISNAGVSASTSDVTGTYTFPLGVSYIRIGERSMKEGKFSFYQAITQKEAIEELGASMGGSANNLAGMKIAMIGDSTYAITGGGSLSDQRINDYLEKISDATVSNFAIGGTTMANYRSAGNTWTYYDFVQLMTAKINGDMSEQLNNSNLADKPAHVRNAVTALNSADLSQYDILLINYGTNDFAGESPLTIQDNPYDLRSVTGAMRTMIERIGIAYPNLHIVFNTPFWRCWNSPSDYVDDAFTRENAYHLKLGDYVEGISETAKEYGLPVLNHLFCDGWNRYNMNIYFDNNDGVHFNVAGAKFVARRTYEFLNKQGFALGTIK